MNYCTTIEANCTAKNQQYPDTASCLAVCAAFPVGMAADTSGDTLGCRTYHAGAAMAMPDVHCAHAGPTGGDGVCGDECTAFCEVAAKNCTGANQQWTDAASCMKDCAQFKKTTGYSVADTSTNDAGCRMYHLSVASKDAASATTHCAHIALKSAVCTQ